MQRLLAGFYRLRMPTRIRKPARFMIVLASVVALVGLSVLAVSCSSRKQTGDISGNVLCGGVPVLMGEVMLQGEDGHCVSGAITNGHFTILQAPVGTMQVTVTGLIHPPVGQRPAVQKRLAKLMEAARLKAEKAGKEFSESDFDDPNGVPKKYSTTKSSRLTYQVKPGKQTYDLNLEGVPEE